MRAAHAYPHVYWLQQAGYVVLVAANRRLLLSVSLILAKCVRCDYGCDNCCTACLQTYAKEFLAEGHCIQEGFMLMGLSVADSAIVWLTTAQRDAVYNELERMEECLSYETSAWWLSDVLARARIANNRMPSRR